MPVGPEFQDPSNEPGRPYFVAPLGNDGPPFYEQAVTLTGKQQFVAAVGDDNVRDTLTVRWVANYPPYNKGASLLLSETVVDRAGAVQGTSTLTVDCGKFMGGADQNLVVIVSANGFIPSANIFQDMRTARSQIPYNFDALGNPVATMTGWRIAGCLP